jgi:hypothetical protein
VLLVLLVLAGVAGYVIVRRYGPGLVEAGRQTFEEGAEYGQRTDNEGCLNEAVARHARADGLTAMIKNGVFMRSCLEASRPTPGFCDDVPGRTEFMKSFAWQAQQCQRFGLRQEQQCGQLFQQVQQFCEMRGRAPNSDAGAGPAAVPPPPPAPTPTPRGR